MLFCTYFKVWFFLFIIKMWSFLIWIYMIFFFFVTLSLFSVSSIVLCKWLIQGSPTPGPQTGIGLRPVRNRAAQHDVSGRRWASEASPAAPRRSPSLPVPPRRSHHHLNHPPSLTPGPWKNCLPWNRSLVPKRLGTDELIDIWVEWIAYKEHSCTKFREDRLIILKIVLLSEIWNNRILVSQIGKTVEK